MIREMKFSDVDDFKRKKAGCDNELLFCKKNIESIQYKLKKIEGQKLISLSGSDLHDSFRLTLQLEMALNEEIKRRVELIERCKEATVALNAKFAENNAFGRLIDRKRNEHNKTTSQ